MTASRELRKIQDGSTGAALSPDGSRIAFLKGREIWTMSPDGQHLGRVFAAAPGQLLLQVDWSPGGRWLTFLRKAGQAGDAVLEARLPGAANGMTIFDNPDLHGFCWLSPGHIVLNRWETPEQPTSNLWEMDVDPKTMKPVDKPRRLTNWAGFAVGDMSASGDGHRLGIAKRVDHNEVFTGELLDRGEKMLHLRRLTSDARIHWPGGWSPDSKWLLLHSDRTGHMGIFRQGLDSDNAEPIVTNLEDNWSPMLSPDQQWILYMVSQQSATRLMRIAVTGGSPELILEMKGPPAFVRSMRVPLIAGGHHTTTMGNPAFRCPAQPGPPCMLSEAIEGEIVFSSFNPVPQAKKTEMLRFAVDDPNSIFWDLSEDGTRIAFGNRGAYSFLRVRELIGDTTHDISILGWPELQSVGWSADGKSLFAADYAPTGASLLHITMDGRVAVLYKAPGPIELPKASPNGRHLAFGQVVSDSNVWLIEGIPQ